MQGISNLSQIFNSQLIDLFNDILLVFPKDIEIIDAKKTLILLKKTNPKLPLKTWKECISNNYKTQIENSDIDFFLNYDYRKDIHLFNINIHILEKIFVIRNPVRKMNNQNQKKIMLYIQNLTKIADLYN